MAAAARGDPRAQRGGDSRRDQFPQAGPPLGGRRAQYCGALGKVANCQVAVTAALLTGVRAWMLGTALYVPQEWLTGEARDRRAFRPLRFQEKWRLALTLLRQVRAAGFQITAVLADAEFGDNATLRRTLHRLKLPYALGISSTLTVFRGTPTVAIPPRQPGRSRPPTRLQLTDDRRPEAVRAIARQCAERSRLAPCDLAQRHQSPMDGGPRGLARHASSRLATPSLGARGLAAVRTRPRVDAPGEGVSCGVAGDGLAARGRATGASSVGHRATVAKS